MEDTELMLTGEHGDQVQGDLRLAKIYIDIYANGGLKRIDFRYKYNAQRRPKGTLLDDDLDENDDEFLYTVDGQIMGKKARRGVEHKDEEYLYDKDGNVVGKLVDAAELGQVNGDFIYDADGNVLCQRGQGDDKDVLFDADGNKIGLVLEKGQKINRGKYDSEFVYDADGNMVCSRTDLFDNDDGFIYDKDGNVVGERIKRGHAVLDGETAEDYLYSAEGDMLGKKVKRGKRGTQKKHKGKKSKINPADYIYTSEGDPFCLRGKRGINDPEEKKIYDNIGRAVGYKIQEGTKVEVDEEDPDADDYIFDAQGKIVGRREKESRNLFKTANEDLYMYDHNGHIIGMKGEKPEKDEDEDSDDEDDKKDLFLYDNEGNIVAKKAKSTAYDDEYVYNGEGFVMGKKVLWGEEGETDKDYVYDNLGHIIGHKVDHKTDGETDYQYMYDSKGNILGKRGDDDGDDPTKILDEDGDLVGTKVELGKIIGTDENDDNIYDGDGSVVGKKAFRGEYNDNYLYDEDGNIIGEKVRHGREVLNGDMADEYLYDDDGKMICKKVRQGVKSAQTDEDRGKYIFDSEANIICKKGTKGEDDPNEKFIYNNKDKVVAKKVRQGTKVLNDADDVEYVYDVDGNRLAKMLAEDLVEAEDEFIYDNMGNIVGKAKRSVEDPVPPEYLYDNMGAIVGKRFYGGRTDEKYVYNIDGNIIGRRLAEGEVNDEEYVYDRDGCIVGLKVKVDAAEESDEQFIYDANGNIIGRGQKGDSNIYDKDGNLLGTKAQKGAKIDTGKDDEEFIYDNDGKVFAKKIDIDDEDGFIYDAEGNKIGQKLRRGRQMINGDSAKDYVYDQEGNLICKKLPKGKIGRAGRNPDDEFIYDSNGEIVRKRGHSDDPDEDDAWIMDNRGHHVAAKCKRGRRMFGDDEGMLFDADGNALFGVYGTLGAEAETSTEEDPYIYSNEGYVVGMKGQAGFNPDEFLFDNDGNIIGKKLFFEKDPEDDFLYDKDGFIVGRMFAKGETDTDESYLYDTEGHIIGRSKTGAFYPGMGGENDQEVYLCDKDGNVIGRKLNRPGEKNSDEFMYNEDGSIVGRKFRQAENPEPKYFFDKDGNIIGKRYLDGEPDDDSDDDFVYNEDGHIAGKRIGGATKKPADMDREDASEFIYNNKGVVIGVKLGADGEAPNADYLYDEHGHVIGKRPRQPGDEDYVYDKNGNAIAKKIKAGDEETAGAEAYAYDSRGQIVAKMVHPKDEYIYDRKGHIIAKRIRSIDEAGSDDEFLYNVEGAVLGKKIKGSKDDEYLYDDDGNIVGKKLKGGMDDAEETYIYNASGKVIGKKPNHKKEEFVYDKEGNIIARNMEHAAKDDAYVYDSEGRVIGKKPTFSMKGNCEDEYIYDNDGHIVAKRMHGDATDNVDEDFLYDAVGNIFGKMLEDEFLYNKEGHIVAKRLRDGETDVPDDKYLYDAAGNILGKATEEGDNGYIYDCVGNIFAKKIDDEDMDDVDEEYVYDNDGNIIGKKLREEYLFDCEGHVIAKKLHKGQTEDNDPYIYDVEGNFVGKRAFVDSNDKYIYDNAGRPIGRKLVNGDMSVPAEEYLYDADGNVLAKTPGSADDDEFVYDCAGHIIGRKIVDGAEDVPLDEYFYDITGNILGKKSDAYAGHGKAEPGRNVVYDVDGNAVGEMELGNDVMIFCKGTAVGVATKQGVHVRAGDDGLAYTSTGQVLCEMGDSEDDMIRDAEGVAIAKRIPKGKNVLASNGNEYLYDSKGNVICLNCSSGKEGSIYDATGLLVGTMFAEGKKIKDGEDEFVYSEDGTSICEKGDDEDFIFDSEGTAIGKKMKKGVNLLQKMSEEGVDDTGLLNALHNVEGDVVCQSAAYNKDGTVFNTDGSVAGSMVPSGRDTAGGSKDLVYDSNGRIICEKHDRADDFIYDAGGNPLARKIYKGKSIDGTEAEAPAAEAKSSVTYVCDAHGNILCEKGEDQEGFICDASGNVVGEKMKLGKSVANGDAHMLYFVNGNVMCAMGDDPQWVMKDGKIIGKKIRRGLSLKRTKSFAASLADLSASDASGSGPTKIVTSPLYLYDENGNPICKKSKKDDETAFFDEFGNIVGAKIAQGTKATVILERMLYDRKGRPVSRAVTKVGDDFVYDPNGKPVGKKVKLGRNMLEVKAAAIAARKSFRLSQRMAKKEQEELAAMLRAQSDDTTGALDSLLDSISQIGEEKAKGGKKRNTLKGTSGSTSEENTPTTKRRSTTLGQKTGSMDELPRTAGATLQKAGPAKSPAKKKSLALSAVSALSNEGTDDAAGKKAGPKKTLLGKKSVAAVSASAAGATATPTPEEAAEDALRKIKGREDEYIFDEIGKPFCKKGGDEDPDVVRGLLGQAMCGKVKQGKSISEAPDDKKFFYDSEGNRVCRKGNDDAEYIYDEDDHIVARKLKKGRNIKDALATLKEKRNIEGALFDDEGNMIIKNHGEDDEYVYARDGCILCEKMKQGQKAKEEHDDGVFFFDSEGNMVCQKGNDDDKYIYDTFGNIVGKKIKQGKDMLAAMAPKTGVKGKKGKKVMKKSLSTSAVGEDSSDDDEAAATTVKGKKGKKGALGKKGLKKSASTVSADDEPSGDEELAVSVKGAAGKKGKAAAVGKKGARKDSETAPMDAPPPMPPPDLDVAPPPMPPPDLDVAPPPMPPLDDDFIPPPPGDIPPPPDAELSADNFAYSDNGQVLCKLGREDGMYVRDEEGNLMYQKVPLGFKIDGKTPGKYFYDSAGNMIGKKGLGPEKLFIYDADGQKFGKKIKKGKNLKGTGEAGENEEENLVFDDDCVFDIYGNVLCMKDENANGDYIFDANGTAVCETVPQGRRAKHGKNDTFYDKNGLMLCKLGREDEKFLYSEEGELIGKKIERGKNMRGKGEEEFQLEDAMNLSLENADNYLYNADGTVIANKVCAGDVDRVIRDESGRAVCTTIPKGMHVEKAKKGSFFDASGNRVCKKGKEDEEFIYDSKGNKIARKLLKGRDVKASLAEGAEMKPEETEETGAFLYNAEAHTLCRIGQADGEFLRDKEGNALCETVKQGKTAGNTFADAQYIYDDDGKVICKKGLEDDEYYYAEDGTKLARKVPMGVDLVELRDKLHQTASSATPEQYAMYDAEGNMLCSKATFGTLEDNNIYDDAGNLLCSKLTQGTKLDDGSEDFFYDEDGKMLFKKGLEDDRYIYDENGRIAGRIFQRGQNAKRSKVDTSGENAKKGVVYDQHGNIIGCEGDDLANDYMFDVDGRAMGMKIQGGVAQKNASEELLYGTDGRIVARMGPYHADYIYDSMNTALAHRLLWGKDAIFGEGKNKANKHFAKPDGLDYLYDADGHVLFQGYGYSNVDERGLQDIDGNEIGERIHNGVAQLEGDNAEFFFYDKHGRIVCQKGAEDDMHIYDKDGNIIGKKLRGGVNYFDPSKFPARDEEEEEEEEDNDLEEDSEPELSPEFRDEAQRYNRTCWALGSFEHQRYLEEGEEEEEEEEEDEDDEDDEDDEEDSGYGAASSMDGVSRLGMANYNLYSQKSMLGQSLGNISASPSLAYLLGAEGGGPMCPKGPMSKMVLAPGDRRLRVVRPLNAELKAYFFPITYLDGTTESIMVTDDWEVYDLITRVAEHLNCIEFADLFEICMMVHGYNTTEVEEWLPFHKTLKELKYGFIQKEQLLEKTFVFRMRWFKVPQNYTQSPSMIHQVYLHVKHSLIMEDVCMEETASNFLAGIKLQVEFGDYKKGKLEEGYLLAQKPGDYLCKEAFSMQTPEEREEKIISEWKLVKGWASSTAEREYIKVGTSPTAPMWGATVFHFQTPSGEPRRLSVLVDGVLILGPDASLIRFITYKDIMKMNNNEANVLFMTVLTPRVPGAPENAPRPRENLKILTPEASNAYTLIAGYMHLLGETLKVPPGVEAPEDLPPAYLFDVHLMRDVLLPFPTLLHYFRYVTNKAFQDAEQPVPRNLAAAVDATIEANSSLPSINLEMSGLNDQSMQALANSFSRISPYINKAGVVQNFCVTMLNLSGNKIGDKRTYFPALQGIAQNLHSLKRLKLQKLDLPQKLAQHVGEAIRPARHLQELNLNNNPSLGNIGVGSILIRIEKVLPELSMLCLADTGITERVLPTIVDTINSHEHLCSVCIANNSFKNAPKAMGEMISATNHLHDLDVSGCDLPKAAGKHMAEVFPANRGLTRLRVANNPCAEVIIRAVISLIAQNRCHFELLDFSDNNLKPAVLVSLFKAIQNENARIQSLILDRNTIPVSAAPVIAALDESRLQNVSLVGCKAQKSVLMSFCQYIRQFRLVKLNLSNMSIPPSCVIELGMALGDAKSIQEFRFNNVSLKPASSEQFFSHLKRNRSLKVLSLNGVHLTGAALAHLAAWINLSNCPLEELLMQKITSNSKDIIAFLSVLDRAKTHIKMIDLRFTKVATKRLVSASKHLTTISFLF